MFSKFRHIQDCICIYVDLGYDLLICHPNVFNLWFVNCTKALAIQTLEKLKKVVASRSWPIVFVTFPKGLKACLYKFLKFLQGLQEVGSPYRENTNM